MARHGNNDRTLRQRPVPPAFTLIELLVVVAIIALLMSILMPALGRARAQGKRTKCLSNVRQQIMAAHMYAQEYKDQLPVARWQGAEFEWRTYPPLRFAPFVQDLLIPYLGGSVRGTLAGADPNSFVPFSMVFRCPEPGEDPNNPNMLKGTDQNHYRYNTHKAVVYRDLHTMYLDGASGRVISSVRVPGRAVVFYDVAWPDWPLRCFSHQGVRGGLSAGYVDGHAGFLTSKEYLALSPYAPFQREDENAFIANGWDVYSVQDPNQ
jgi:prepilin-type N-terminal cleavage/methylation domain-containing protein